MSPQETNDLNELNEAVLKLKVSCIDTQMAMSKYRPEELKSSGFKTVEDAIKFVLLSKSKEIQKITNDYLKKYPDES